MKRNMLTIAFAIIWLLIVTELLCLPGTEFPRITWSDKILLDKWIHVFLFMILVIVWNKAYTSGKRIQKNTKKIAIRIMLVALIYGILMELVQKYFIPFRSFDLGDIIADGIGCAIGYFISLKRLLRAE